MLSVPSSRGASRRGARQDPGRPSGLSGLALVGLLAASGLLACADEIPGVSPPADQVYFPTAIAAVGSGLIVVSSNFDQRYNAGRVHSFDLAALSEMAPTNPGEIVFDEDLAPASQASLRIDQFGSDIVLLPGFLNQDRLLIPSRGRNRLSMINVVDDKLTCGPPPEAPTRFDCAGGFTSTEQQDPFTAVVVDNPAVSDEPVAFVAHIRGIRDDDEVYRQSIARVRLSSLAGGAPEDFTLDEDREPEPVYIPERVENFEFRDFGGVTGITFVPAGRLGIPAGSSRRVGTIVAVEARVTPTLTLRGFTVRQLRRTRSYGKLDMTTNTTSAASLTADVLELEEAHELDLSSEAGASGSRGLVYDADRERIYVSLRFQESGDSFNAGIATVAVDGETFRLLHIAEVGEELGTPVLRVAPGGGRWLYVPDIRRDTIYVVDVSTDAPTIRHQIEGLGERDFDGVAQQVPLLASPAGIAFHDVGGRSLGFVSNFANSTIAVLDVTDPDPSSHRVVARLGRDLDAEGEMEMPQR